MRKIREEFNMKMKKILTLLTVIITVIIGYGFTNKVSANTIQKEVEIARVYNPNTGEHLFTPSIFEKSYLIDIGWKGEGTAFFVPDPTDTGTSSDNGPYLRRLYNPNAGEHFYTASGYEANYLVNHGWKRDFVTIPTAKKGIPAYRLYNPNAKVGSHHYTTSAYERDSLVKMGWKYEGVGFYVLR